MSQTPENLKYTQEHEWILVEGQQGTIGITDFAQKALGDIVYVELPEVGTILQKGKAFGVVESIKSVSDLYAPVSGEVLEVNQDLIGSPENCNADPYGSWMIKVKFSKTQEISDLLGHLEYKEHCNKGS